MAVHLFYEGLRFYSLNNRPRFPPSLLFRKIADRAYRAYSRRQHTRMETATDTITLETDTYDDSTLARLRSAALCNIILVVITAEIRHPAQRPPGGKAPTGSLYIHVLL